MLSIIIPARNEKYLENTVKNILENAEGEIEVIVELDGWNPEIKFTDERVVVVHHKEGIGQRACINHGAKIAKGEYIMKLDAHCAVSKGFDVILARDCKYEWTMVPRMYNLRIDDWTPKLHKRTDYMYISSPQAEKPFRASYYGSAQPKRFDVPIDETMCCMGPGWFMHKKRFWEQDGCDENHKGGWGQQGIEVALKAWLSGGALMVNKNCWFAHWFRGGKHDPKYSPGFPYKISGRTVEDVRRYSRDLWLNNAWDKQVRTIEWLVDKFDPPGWDTSLTLIYYTANIIHTAIEYSVLRSLKQFGYPIVSVSQKPMDLGKNIIVPMGRSLKKIYEQVLVGARAAKTEYVGLCEDDCLYTKEHFKHRPKKDFAYNLNRWNLHLDHEVKCYSYRNSIVLSQCIAKREALIAALEAGDRDKEFGKGDGIEYETFKTKTPNLVFCHKGNKTGRKYIGKDAEPVIELEPYGTVQYWLDKFKRRGMDFGTPKRSDK